MEPFECYPSSDDWVIGRQLCDLLRVWCIKEGVLKALGIGLKADLHGVTVNLSTSPLSVILTGDVRMMLGKSMRGR